MPEAATSPGLGGGDLDEDAAAELKQTFDLYDVDRNGVISIEENLEVDRGMHGGDFDEAASRASFAEFDSGRDGTVSWAEFRGGVVKQQNALVAEYNVECKRLHGAHAEFDGAGACTCEEGYTVGEDEQCVAERRGGIKGGLGGMKGSGGGRRKGGDVGDILGGRLGGK